MSDPAAAMAAGLEAGTGHNLDWWVERAIASGKEKHGEIVTYLKSELDLTHGYANLVAIKAREHLAGGPPSNQDLVAGQYRGKESLIPVFESLLALATGLGTDVEVAPKKASVSLRRSKQFALIEPATRTRIDLGLNLKGHPGSERLKVAGAMCTHKVAVTTVDDVDEELAGWIREAYESA